MQALVDVVAVQARPDFSLLLEFDNGEKRVFDMIPYLHKKPFEPLQRPSLFALATVDYGTVVWPGSIDISPDTLYDRSVLLAN